MPLQPIDAAPLAWLAIEGPTPRARMAALLWPGIEPEAARNTLRQRLFQLKKQLASSLGSGNVTLALVDGVTRDLLGSDGELRDAGHAFGGEIGGTTCAATVPLRCLRSAHASASRCSLRVEVFAMRLRMNREPTAAWFYAAAIVAAAPLAWATAAAGYGIAVGDPRRDLVVLAVASVAEEIVFRGALQPALARLLDHPSRLGVTPANALTSLVFAALHLWRHPPVVALAVFFVSLVYGKARELSGSVWPSALLHLTFNGLLYAASSLRHAT